MTPEFRAGERDTNPRHDSKGVSFACVECGRDSDAWATFEDEAGTHYVCKRCDAAEHESDCGCDACEYVTFERGAEREP